MPKLTRDKWRLALLAGRPVSKSGFGFMRGSVKIIGNIVGPVWGNEPWDAELGIAYHGKNGPVYYTGKGCEITDDH